ncbi:hypothetical protein A374_07679 [Fictibacillus macauensis ZFHKF-1]|uniref:Uncharacterized protein n=1 Tax=Fictibacillus macauensis ZFHKF-1 TaxID=1196324 RepID=I8AJJ9_9BACL|nr:hypothetical protein [Fictibacillus macauensis]EIT85699.1 hypothetical protein A374_07679 [Fictibacillus macauensis ZFHKF-1]
MESIQNGLKDITLFLGGFLNVTVLLFVIVVILLVGASRRKKRKSGGRSTPKDYLDDEKRRGPGE